MGLLSEREECLHGLNGSGIENVVVVGGEVGDGDAEKVGELTTYGCFNIENAMTDSVVHIGTIVDGDGSGTVDEDVKATFAESEFEWNEDEVVGVDVATVELFGPEMMIDGEDALGVARELLRVDRGWEDVITIEVDDIDGTDGLEVVVSVGVDGVGVKLSIDVVEGDISESGWIEVDARGISTVDGDEISRWIVWDMLGVDIGTKSVEVSGRHCEVSNFQLEGEDKNGARR